jgi:RNA polymerase sigma-70 factor (ECF subfamily)
MIACLPEILKRIACDDEQAFADLYNLYHEKLIQFSYSITRSKQTAEETVEDVFINIWCNRSGITQIKDITIYLYTAVKNRSLNILSKKSHEIITQSYDFLQIDLKPLSETPYESMITREMMDKMNAAIEALPPRCKMIFKLVREDGLRYKEVGEILNISVKTIDAQMAIAVKRICTAVGLHQKKKSLLQKITPNLNLILFF